LTKAIILKGATTCNSATGVCNDQTIIQDNISRRLNQGLIELRGNAGQRITGLTFRAGLTGTGYNGMIRVEAGTTPVRIDHCHFNGTYWSPQIGVFSKNWGVLDHNVMDNSRFTLGGFVHFWPGARTDLGDSLWETSAGFGGPNFLFLENNWLEARFARDTINSLATTTWALTEQPEHFVMVAAVGPKRLTTTYSTTLTTTRRWTALMLVRASITTTLSYRTPTESPCGCIARYTLMAHHSTEQMALTPGTITSQKPMERMLTDIRLTCSTSEHYLLRRAQP
jgi:hypothetical protein